MFRKVGAQLRPSLVFLTLLLSWTLPVLPSVLPSTSALSPRDPIRITSDSGFTAANGVTGGSGTSIDPYLIEGWDINASAQTGIIIRFTKAHFIIRNVWVHDGNLSGKPDINGIQLEGVSNARIEDSLVTNNDFGIVLVPTTNTVVTRVKSTGNREYGIYIGGGGNNTITQNDLSDNEDGLLIASSKNNLVEGNLVSGSSTRRRYGFWLSAGATANTVRRNTVIGGSVSFLLNGLANSNIIQSNNSTGPLWFGLNAVGVVDNTLESNQLFGGHVGIVLTNSNRTMITGNFVIKNDYGIGLEVNNWNNTVTGNISGESNLVAMYTSGPGGFNIIYNNILAGKSGDAFDESKTNSWNLTKRPGPNILGGPFIGGNYYSSYQGADPDNDGIGDPAFQIQSSQALDQLPLLPQAEIFDLDWTDYDNNGLVTIEDMAAVALEFEKPSRYWDIGGTGTVDINDVSKAALFFDRTMNSPYPGQNQPRGRMDPIWRYVCKSLSEPEKSYCLGQGT